jgi:hypothetical protein
MIRLQLFLDGLIFSCEVLKNINRYYSSAESFSFIIDFKNRFNFIFQLHPMLAFYTNPATFLKYLSAVWSCLPFRQVLLFISE